ncbi:MAG TPA: DNA polymerase III subunit beta [Candidatus Paceibacterota bacterium]|nr:DNA polymerase III subunit beta [Candidatus Paceibacterota bacterium]
MKIIAIQSNIKEAISVIERVVGENVNLPILKNTCIKAVGGSISFTTTNLEIAATCRVSGKVIEDGAVTVPVGLLSSVIGNIKSDRLNLETKGNVLEVKTDNYNATIQGLPAEDFPPTPKIGNPGSYLEIKGVFLKDAIREAGAAAQASDLRPELNSILFDFSLETLKLTATDGFRLAEKTIPASAFTVKDLEPFRALVPLKTGFEVLRIMKDDGLVRVCFDRNQVVFTTDQIELVSRLVDGNFPEYSQIIPKKFTTEIVVDTDELSGGVKLAAVFGQKNGEVAIKVHPNKKAIEIVSADQALGENAYLLPAKIKGDAAEVVFNWRYLSDPLKVIRTEEVLLGLQEEANPAIIRPATDGSYFYVIKPILKG